MSTPESEEYNSKGETGGVLSSMKNWFFWGTSFGYKRIWLGIQLSKSNGKTDTLNFSSMWTIIRPLGLKYSKSESSGV